MEEIIELFFKAANMQRWNDHIRPVEFVELDKQAHKMIIAYILAKVEEDKNGSNSINWTSLIEKFLFEFFYRLVLTDLKPPVFHQMIKNKKKELNYFVLENIGPILDGVDTNFSEKFKRYIESDKKEIEDKIISASHYLATDWEFKIIYNTAPFIYGVEKTKEDIEKRIKQYYELESVKEILLFKDLYGFLDLCGQLRFQKRWAHTPRVPETSVLGHMLLVAGTSYFFTLNSQDAPCEKRIYNNFFGALFHDLPEVMTKDIISPIKRSVKGLEELIKEYEDNQMKEVIFPLIPKKWGEELSYLTKDEFTNKIIKDNKIISNLSFEEMNKYNKNSYSPVDGKIIDVADKLAAFAEATISIRHGVTSKELEKAVEDIKTEGSKKLIPNIDVKLLYNDLENLINE